MNIIDKLNELEQSGSTLEPAASQRDQLSGQTLEFINNFVEQLPSLPGYTTGNVSRLATLEIGDPKPLEKLLDILHTEVDGVGINSASGRHLGYIPGGGLYTSALADLLVAISNRYAGIAYSSPGAVAIENKIIQWLTSIVNYPATAHGNLTSGGSIANLVAVKAARDFHQITSENIRSSVIYFTAHTHHCLNKAFDITGLQESIHRTIPLNENYQMDVRLLKEQIDSDKAAGLKPFLVVGTAGTTDTGAVDQLDEIATLCDEHNLWFHVDAAYGGFFILTDDAKNKFKGIERSDSLVMDPHKTLFIPYGSGVVLIRNKENLLKSFSHKASYMNDAYGFNDIDPADTGPELSRHFRGLRIWLPLQLHGVAPFKANLEEKLLLAKYFYEEVKKLGLETGPPPDLSVVIFRVPGDADNKLTAALVRKLHDDGRVFLSSTTIHGKLWIRCAVVHFRTHLRDIDVALKMVEAAMDKNGSIRNTGVATSRAR